MASDQGLASKRRGPCQMRSLLAQELAGQIVDEVQPATGSAKDRSVGPLGLVIGRGGQPMLHVHSGLGALVNDRARHARQYDDAGEG